MKIKRIIGSFQFLFFSGPLLINHADSTMILNIFNFDPFN